MRLSSASFGFTSLLTLTIAFMPGSQSTTQADQPSKTVQAAIQLMNDGNVKDAYEIFQREAIKANRAIDITTSLERGLNCLSQLNRHVDSDTFIEDVVAAHPDDWRVVAGGGRAYLRIPHYGFMIAGQFERGQHRGGGEYAMSFDRDRVRALQLLARALEMGNGTDAKSEIAQLCFEIADALSMTNSGDSAWKFQTLTDLATLPDFERQNYGQAATNGAPVDADGNPVYHQLPDSWDAARSDGQRWRWALDQAGKFNPARENEAKMRFADFLDQQFGVQTLQEYGWRFGRGNDRDDSTDRQSGIFALHTLSDNETIARLASGVKRFTLPDEFNPLTIYRDVADSSDGHAARARWQLANSYLNRRQYVTAAQQFRDGKNRFLNTGYRWQDQIQQIEGNWGQFQNSVSQDAGSGARLQYRFRNAKHVAFSARRIDVELFIKDLKAYLNSREGRNQLDWQRLNLERLGYDLIKREQQKYVKEKVASWSLDLKPQAGHFDSEIEVTTPLQEAGAYLVEAKLVDGNVSQIVVWLEDMAIITKPLSKGALYFVSDAKTGRPVAKANVEFLGYRVDYRDNRPLIRTRNFAEMTDQDGLLTVSSEDDNDNYQWLAIARDDADRMAYLGFSSIWHGGSYDSDYSAERAFAVTDRPVYRPDQKVQFKVWIRRAQYDQQASSAFAGRPFTLWIANPKNERVFEQRLTADEYGGIEGEFNLPADATLGEYHLQLDELPQFAFQAPQDNFQYGSQRLGGIFRVEEYKKPEFEVTIDAPEKPIALGDSFTATIRAKYYFGSPVTEATVKYKVLRTNYSGQWYPPSPWDWLYGPGYWWFGCDYDWYPGWNNWGCRCPAPWWFWRAPQQPEVIASAEVPISADGTVEVKIETTLAKELHGDEDHSYQIQAEVVDNSRRTIVANGQVLVAREPFRVYSWLHRGYYRVGDTIQANFAARTLDGKPVSGEAAVTLFKVEYNDEKPKETRVQSWNLTTDTDGQLNLKVAASQPGQYRLTCIVSDSEGHAIEGATLFTIVGKGFDGRDFQFNDIELIPQRRDYAPGDKVALQVNTNRTGGFVLLFVRPANGVYPTPRPIRLDGKSTVVELDVVQKDMPNFFVEAVTVAHGQAHSAIREICVPPQKRVMDVKVEPSAAEYLPGEMATVKFQITDFDGRPFVGSTVVSIYDKSLDYISGGSNVPEIRAFFWKWRRQHQPQQMTNLQRYFPNLVIGGKSMQSLGIFGEVVQLGETRSDQSQIGVRSRGMRQERAAGLSMAKEAAMPASDMAVADGGMGGAIGGDELHSGIGTQPVQPVVRQTFADTALWVASLKTDADGRAEVELKMPENLTAWRVRVWGMGHGTRVGEGSADVVTRKNIIVRLQAPRFFVETDEVVLSAIVHNYLDTAKQVEVRLEMDGNTLTAIDPDSLKKAVSIDADGEARVDWRVKVQSEGEAVVRMLALTDEESDAMQMAFPVYVHGMLKMDSFTGVVRPSENKGRFTVVVPEKRRPEQTRLEVRYSPTLAAAMLDAIPYLLDYPYGCTEQTLNRFLPAVICRNTLSRTGIDLEALQKEHVNLNSQQLSGTDPSAPRWNQLDRSPVFDSAELTSIVKKGVQRLTEMQLSDGGWGWFSGYGEHSSPHTTAVVVHGLQVAAANDVAIVPGVLDRGIVWLKTYQERELAKLDNVKDGQVVNKKLPAKLTADNLDALVFMVLTDADADTKSNKMRDYLYRDRTKLSVYGLAMYGLSLHKLNEAEKLAMVMRNIQQYLVEDDENQTAHLNMGGSYWWYWYGSEMEAHAYYLKLLASTQPKSEVAPRLVKYMLNNRRNATHWNSTRDTALVIEAFADYLAATKEMSPDMTVEVWVDGKMKKQVKIDAGNLFSYDDALVIDAAELAGGEHVVELRKQGSGALYYSGYLTNFTLEDMIHKSGLELKVQRRYYRLRRDEKTTATSGSRGQVVDQQVEKFVREPLVNFETVISGDLVEIELEIESKNDYEYILLEDMKPAGFEPVDVRSGYTGNEMGAYVEFRDNRVAMFLQQLARGRHSISYRMRAETPGKFSALPTRASAMYAPELKGNSDEIKLQVVDK